MSWSAKSRDHHLVTVERLAGDEYSHTSTDATETGTTYVTKESITFTATAGKYYMLCKASVMQDTAAQVTTVSAYDGTTNYGEMTMTPIGSTSEERSWMFLVRLEPGAGSETWGIQLKTSSGGTARLTSQSIWIFREDSFADPWYFNGTTTETETATSMTATEGTLEVTPPVAGDYLIIATAIVTAGNNATINGEHQLEHDDNGTPTVKSLDSLKAGIANMANNRYAHGYAEVLTLPATTQTFEFQQRRTGSGLGASARTYHKTIAALRLPVAATPPPPSAGGPRGPLKHVFTGPFGGPL